MQVCTKTKTPDLTTCPQQLKRIPITSKSKKTRLHSNSCSSEIFHRWAKSKQQLPSNGLWAKWMYRWAQKTTLMKKVPSPNTCRESLREGKTKRITTWWTVLNERSIQTPRYQTSIAEFIRELLHLIYCLTRRGLQSTSCRTMWAKSNQISLPPFKMDLAKEILHHLQNKAEEPSNQ